MPCRRVALRLGQFLALAGGLALAGMLVGCDTTHTLRSDIQTCLVVDTVRHESKVLPCPTDTLVIP